MPEWNGCLPTLGGGRLQLPTPPPTLMVTAKSKHVVKGAKEGSDPLLKILDNLKGFNPSFQISTVALPLIEYLNPFVTITGSGHLQLPRV